MGQRKTLRFYAPRNEAHVSFGRQCRRTDRFFEAQVSTVRELAKKLDDTDIEIIKMDIEGAEYAVLSSLMDQGPLPSTLCVEFDRRKASSRRSRPFATCADTDTHCGTSKGGTTPSPATKPPLQSTGPGPWSPTQSVLRTWLTDDGVSYTTADLSQLWACWRP